MFNPSGVPGVDGCKLSNPPVMPTFGGLIGVPGCAPDGIEDPGVPGKLEEP